MLYNVWFFTPRYSVKSQTFIVCFVICSEDNFVCISSNRTKYMSLIYTKYPNPKSFYKQHCEKKQYEISLVQFIWSTKDSNTYFSFTIPILTK